MPKKNTDVDALLDDADESAGGDAVDEETTAAPKAKKAKASKKATPAKKATTAKAAAPAKKASAPAKKATAKKVAAAKKESTPRVALENSPIRKALLKVRRPVSYADFSTANDFNIRTVRRMARDMCAAGELDRVRDGQAVMIRPAV